MLPLPHLNYNVRMVSMHTFTVILAACSHCVNKSPRIVYMETGSWKDGDRVRELACGGKLAEDNSFLTEAF